MILSIAAAGFALATVFGKPRLGFRWINVWLFMFALGAIYLGGEEASWGQHLFGWEASDYWGEVNDQEETNLHNLREFAFTNELPRNLLTISAIVGGVVVPLAFRKKVHESEGAWRRWPFWFWPTRVCLVCSLFLLLPPIPKKLGLPSMPEPGETEEFYMAMLLAFYAGSIWLRKRSLEGGRQEVSSEA